MERKMKKITYAILALFLVVFSTSACTNNVTSGSGKVKTEARNVTGFSGVQFAGLGELDISQGASEGLTIEGEDNILPKIITEVRSGILYIGFERDNWQDMVRPTRNIVFTLKVKSLNSFDLSGLGNVKMPKLSADSLAVKVSGAGGVKIEQISAKTVTSSISGAGNVDLAGKISSQTITMNGLGNYNAGDLESQTASVTVSGAGGATVWAKDSLTVKIGGVGSVGYYGSPKISKDVTGLGVINSLGSK
jgi:predicted small secreted protein